MNTQETEQEPPHIQLRRDTFFAEAKIGDRLRYEHSPGVHRYAARRNNTPNSSIYIDSRSGSRLEVDASEVTLLRV